MTPTPPQAGERAEALDAARYRFLRGLFDLRTDTHKWIEEVGTNRRGQILSEPRAETYWRYELNDEIYGDLAGRCSKPEDAPTLDTAIDAAIAALDSEESK